MKSSVILMFCFRAASSWIRNKYFHWASDERSQRGAEIAVKIQLLTADIGSLMPPFCGVCCIYFWATWSISARTSVIEQSIKTEIRETAEFNNALCREPRLFMHKVGKAVKQNVKHQGSTVVRKTTNHTHIPSSQPHPDLRHIKTRAWNILFV